MSTYLYVDPALQNVGSFQDSTLEQMTERHHFRLPALQIKPAGSIETEIDSTDAAGVLFGLDRGIPGRHVLGLAARLLRRGRAVYLYWPSEAAAEVVDHERLHSLRLHWVAYIAARNLVRVGRWIHRKIRGESLAPRVSRIAGGIAMAVPYSASGRDALQAAQTDLRNLHARADAIAAALRGVSHPQAGIADLNRGTAIASAVEQLAGLRAAVEAVQGRIRDGEAALAQLGGQLEHLTQVSSSALSGWILDSSADSLVRRYLDQLTSFSKVAEPVPFSATNSSPRPDSMIPGTGVYVRADFWSQLTSGGSYGHTCYVAQELARVTENFVCLLGSSYPLLTELGVRQEIMRPPATTMTDLDLIGADEFYHQALKARIAELRPSYMYERLVLGNFAAARISRELGIPYIVEYNGSEISMSRSFGTGGYKYESLFLAAERFAFEQATAITVISDHVRNDLVGRGIDPAKILVNPNGVDLTEYAPGAAETRRGIRQSLGLPDQARVIAFVGTFGGWHGIDVLARAIPEICRQAPDARFLLIGDGALKPQVTNAVRANGLEGQVVDMGRVEQRAAARLLKAADVYVSPHSSNMKDMPFFGSSTKLFEYMGLAGGIVASDLEQLGVVLSPALRPTDFATDVPRVTHERAVLCRPGSVEDFVAGVVALVRYPEVSTALGRNARAAAQEYFSWEKHVGRIWQHLLGQDHDASWRKAS